MKIISTILNILVGFPLVCGALFTTTCSESGNSSPAELLLNEINPLEFFFTHPGPGADGIRKHAARNEALKLTDRARVSIRMWCYGFNDTELIEALVRARERGVRVDIVGSPERDYTNIREAGLNISTRASSGLQHVKLMIFDDEILYSGTGNFTRSGFFYNHNAFWTARLGKASAQRLTHALNTGPGTGQPEVGLPWNTIPGARVLTAPVFGRQIQTEIIRAIFAAQSSIAYMSFSHTDPVISAALYAAARRGVVVEGIYDYQAFSAGSRARQLNDRSGLLPLLLYRDGNRAEYESEDGVVHGGHLHHKTLIIDGVRVLTGSYNWSMSARDRNLELLFDLGGAGPIFLEEFKRIRARSELVPRTAHVPEQTANFSLKGGGQSRLCSTAAPKAGLIRFVGRGPFFRGEYLPASASSDSDGCRAWEKFAQASAGPRGLRKYADGPDSEFSAVLGPGGVYIALENDSEQWPCENPAVCPALIIKRAWKRDGLLLIPHGGDLRSVRFLSAKGFHQETEMTRVGPDLYAFAPGLLPAGDLALFIRDGLGRNRTACLRSGKAFTGPARDVLESLNALRGEAMHCPELE